MVELKKGEKYVIVGLGTMEGDERCSLNPEDRATGYIRGPNNREEMVPVNLKRFGPAPIGGEAEFLG